MRKPKRAGRTPKPDPQSMRSERVVVKDRPPSARHRSVVVAIRKAKKTGNRIARREHNILWD